MFDVQASLRFPTEAPSGGAAVIGMASVSSPAGFLLSNEVFWLQNLPGRFSLTWMLSQNCLHLTVLGTSAWLADAFKVAGEGHIDIHPHVHPLAPLQDGIIAQVLFPWKQG